MKKHLRLPLPMSLMIFAMTIVACGKNSAGPSPASIGEPAAVLAPSSPTLVPSDLLAFCRDNLGTMSADQLSCKFEINYSYGSSSTVGVWVSPAYVLKNDTVDLKHSGTPIPAVGNQDYSPGTMHFTSQYEGYLSFRGQSALNAYTVKEIHIKRCFNSRSTTVVCAN